MSEQITKEIDINTLKNIFIDCYVYSEGDKGYIKGYPESTYLVDILDNDVLSEKLDILNSQFSELYLVNQTNGQSINKLSELEK